VVAYSEAKFLLSIADDFSKSKAFYLSHYIDCSKEANIKNLPLISSILSSKVQKRLAEDLIFCFFFIKKKERKVGKMG